HPDGQRCYLVGELDGTVTAYELTADGSLHRRTRVEASGRSGHVQPSEVAVRPDGRFLYVANRGVGTLAVFELRGDRPELVGEVDTGGEWPRHFALLGEHLYVADERAHMVRGFSVDRSTGLLEAVGEPLSVPSPTCVLP
ncbi:lactonase family protein, partial [Micromonospora azadirachtae]